MAILCVIAFILGLKYSEEFRFAINFLPYHIHEKYFINPRNPEYSLIPENDFVLIYDVILSILLFCTAYLIFSELFCGDVLNYIFQKILPW
jgi:hypothetical protein